MNAFTMAMITAGLQALPALANDIKDAVSAAESSEAGKDKAKAILADVAKAIETLAEVI